MLALPALVFARLSFAAPPVDLDWQAPRECPPAVAVVDMVGALLRQPTGDAVPARAVARAVVTRTGARWQLRLALRGQGRSADYRRTIHAESCQDLARATALLIAIHLDPLSVSRRLPADLSPRTSSAASHDLSPRPSSTSPNDPPLSSDMSPRTSSTSPNDPPLSSDMSPGTSSISPSSPPSDMSPGTSSPPVLPPDPSPGIPAPDPSARSLTPPLLAPRPPVAPRSPPLGSDDMSEETAEITAARRPPAPAATPRVLGHLRLEGGLDAGVLPTTGGFAGLFGGVSLPRLRLEAGIVGTPLRILPVQGDSAGGRFDRLGAVIRVCPTWYPRPALAFLLCAGAEVGAIRGVALAVSAPNPRWAPWAGFSLGPALRWRASGPVGLWLSVEGLLAVNRPGFTVHADELVYRSGRAGLRIGFGLDLQFGPRNR